MSAEGKMGRDAVGQFIRKDDLVGGVRLGQYPVTVAGQVVKIGERQVKIRVMLVTDSGDHDRRTSAYAKRSVPDLGSEVWVYTERVFKVDAIFTEEEEPG